MTMSQQINLYDPTLLKQRDLLALGNVAIAGVLLIAAVLAPGMLARHEVPALTAQTAANDVQLKAAREQITLLGQQLAGRKPDPRLEQELGAARLLLGARGEVLTSLQQRLGPDAGSYTEYLRGFSRQSVAGLWLTAFDFDGSGGMEIHGRTVDPALLPEYIRRLGKEPAFQGRTFAALQLAAGKPEPLASTPVAAPTQTAAAQTAKAPFHEFMLIPARADGKPAVSPRATMGEPG